MRLIRKPGSPGRMIRESGSSGRQVCEPESPERMVCESGSMGRLIRKLKSSSGESIAETLVAVLISAFALMMLAGTINTATRLITNSQDKLGKYYSSNNLLAEETESEESSTQNTFTVVLSDGSSSTGSVGKEWSNVPYYELTSDDSSIIGDNELIVYSLPQEE